ncbi:hypothetical protein HY493_02015 [Candidatus Woesearchaeota archaeon]|nr:hypothetical protein [Candidatus Woesearchaeota archaeon]
MADPIAPPIASQEKRGFGSMTLFGSKPTPLEPADTSLQQDVQVMTTRLRVSEERYADLRRKLQLIEQNLLLHQKKNQQELKTLQSDVLEVKRLVRSMEDRIVTVIKELQLTSKKEDVDVLKRYVEMWDPIRFVSFEQVEKIIDEKMGKHTEEMHEE